MAGPGRATGGTVWLVFPPLLTSNQHPEVGVPELTANLRAAGHVVRQRDLNIELVYDHMTRGDVLAGLARWLIEVAPEVPLGAPRDAERWFARLDRAAAAIGAGPTGRTLGLLDFLEHERRRTNRPGRPDEGWIRYRMPLATPAMTAGWPAILGAEAEGFLVLAATLPRFWGTLVDALQYLFLAPRSFAAPDVLAAAARPLPVLTPFYDRVLGELAEGGAAPDVFGVSLHGADQLVPALHLFAEVRRRWPAAVRVAGGPFCTAAGELLPRVPALFELLDAVVLGEGHDALAALAEGRPLAEVPGALQRVDEAIVATPAAPRRPIPALPLPEFGDLPLRLYPEQRLPVRLHCGCTWGRCRFCYHVFPGVHDIGAAPVDEAHVTRVARALGELTRRFGVRTFALLDHAVPFRTLRAFARAVRAAGLDIEWDTMARFEPGMTPEVCRELYAAGGRDLFLGLETTDPEGLRFLQKGITLDLVEAGVAAAAAAGIRVRLFLLDFPGQSFAALRRTVDWALDQVPAVADVALARFALARGTSGWEGRGDLRLALHEDPLAAPCLDVFDVPFEAAEAVPFEDFKALWQETAVRLGDAREAAHLPRHVRQPGQAAPRPLRALVVPFPASEPAAPSADETPEHADLRAAYVAAFAAADAELRAAFDVEVAHELDPAVHGLGPIAWRIAEEAPAVLLLVIRPDNVRAMDGLLRELAHRPERPLVVAMGPSVVGLRAHGFLARQPVVDVVVRHEPEVTFAAVLRRVRRAAERGALPRRAGALAAAVAGVPGTLVRTADGLVRGLDRPRTEQLEGLPSPYRRRFLRPRARVLLEVRRGAGGTAGQDFGVAAIADVLAFARDHGYRRVTVLDAPLSLSSARRLLDAARTADAEGRLAYTVTLAPAAGGHEVLAALAGLRLDEVRWRGPVGPDVALPAGSVGRLVSVAAAEDDDTLLRTVERLLPPEVLEGARDVLGWSVRGVDVGAREVRVAFGRGGARLDALFLPPDDPRRVHVRTAILAARFLLGDEAGGGSDEGAEDLGRRLGAAVKRLV